MSVWIGPVGSLLESRGAQSVRHDRSQVSSYVTTLGGRVFEQRVAGRGRRSWQVAHPPAARPEEMAVLRALLDGALGPGPWAWLGAWAQVTNLLTPEAALLAVGTTGGAGLVRTGPVTAADGVWLPSSCASDGGLVTVGRPAVTEGCVVPVGRPVTVSVYVAGPGVVTVRAIFQDAAGVQVAALAATPSPGPIPARVVLSGVVPAGVAWVVIAVQGASVIAGPQVTLTPGPMRWVPGEGVWRVSVDGLSHSPVLAAPEARMSPFSYVLQEVG